MRQVDDEKPKEQPAKHPAFDDPRQEFGACVPERHLGADPDNILEFLLSARGYACETTGSWAASHAARPPAISIRCVIPYRCRMPAAIEERYPPAQ